jgi:hypothetical protein
VPHAHHFLERLDRVSRAQTEFALGLYRDDDAVRFVLDRVNLPATAERVALALDDQREGPFVIVTREGRFVTCLGRGMHHDLPTVPREQLDALLAKVADKRARREFAERERRPDEEKEEDIFHRLFTRGSRLAKEDFLAVSAFEQMLGEAPYLLMLDMALDVVKMREAMAYGADRVTIKTTTTKAFERQDRLTWSVAHMMLLCGEAERRDREAVLELTDEAHGSPTLPCGAVGGMTFYLRGAWAAARFGKVVIPAYKRGLAQARDWTQSIDAAMGLGAIGLRHAATMSEVKRILSAQQALDASAPDGSVANTRGKIIEVVLTVLGSVEEYEDRVNKIGRDFAVTLSSHLDEGHPLRFDAPEKVPDDLARTAVLAFDGDLMENTVLYLTLWALPTAARAKAEDFYHRRDVVRAWFGQWTPEETLEKLRRYAKQAPKKEPARAADRPGRNDPCSCGSGKKWKKCCGK